MFDQMKQLMEMKRQADKIKKELDAEKIEVNDVRSVKILINGSQNVQSITVADELINPANKAKLESELTRAVNAAIRRSQEIAASKMKTMTGLNLPGM